jgi:RecA/RadA recombinase
MNTRDFAKSIREGVNKRLGKEAIFVADENTELLQVSDWVDMPDFFKTATGGKGIPCGHITQVVGDSDTGKTTLVMIAMRECQKQNGLVFLIDSEHKFSMERFASMGGDPTALEIIPCESLEDAWNGLDALFLQISEVAAKMKGELPKILLVWDSVAASVADRILTADAEDAHVAVEAKINNIQVRKLRQQIKRLNVAAMFINHTYMSMPKFGIAKEIIKGGAELYYMSTLIVKTKRKSWLKRTVKGIDQKFGIESILSVFKGHFHGRKNDIEFFIVDKNVFTTKEELEEYKESIKGEL